MKKTKMTHADRMRCRRHAAMYEVMGILGWDKATYTTMQYEHGIAYLWAYLGGDQAAIRPIEASPIFWGWWKLHWYIREKGFLNEYNNRWMKGYRNSRIHALRANYQILHNPYDLAQGATPRGKMLDDSYCADLVPKLK